MPVEGTVVFQKTACTGGVAIGHEATVEFFLSPLDQVGAGEGKCWHRSAQAPVHIG